MNKIILITSFLILTMNTSYAEKVECELLSPMQKVIYKAYCASESSSSNSVKESIGSKGNKIVGSGTNMLGKVFGKINTDSKLFKTGKYKDK